MSFIVGADGCKAGWILAIRQGENPAVIRIALAEDIAAIFHLVPDLAVLAIDMPIGLPDVITGPGRVAEQAVRPMLGARQSSVFSIPVRAAVEATDYGEACRAALAGSNPPRKVAKQGFNLFPKILEIDRALRADPARAPRVFETHPEFVFRQIKGESLRHPKKTAEGHAERRDLLVRTGIDAAIIAGPVPSGAGRDDLLDALACSHTALRITQGLARPYPDPPPCDRHGLPIAIWA